MLCFISSITLSVLMLPTDVEQMLFACLLYYIISLLLILSFAITTIEDQAWFSLGP